MVNLDSLTDAELLRYASWDRAPLVQALAERLEKHMHPPKELDVDEYLSMHAGLGLKELAALFPGDSMHSLVAALWSARTTGGVQGELDLGAV